MAFLVPVFSGLGAIFGGGGAAAGAAGAAAGAGAAAAGGGFSLGSVLSIASTGLGVIGSIAQGQAAADAAKYNAAIARQQANMAQDQAAAKATETARQTRQRVAASRAAFGENGFESSGSVADVLGVVQEQGVLDQLTQLNEGAVRAQSLRANAALEDAKAKNARTSGFLNAGSTLLGGFGQLYKGYA